MGYIKCTLVLSGISECFEQFCLILVVPDTNYNLQVPVVIGTNILDKILKDCKNIHGDQYSIESQPPNAMVPLIALERSVASKLPGGGGA